jgi:hypothetical protein
MASATTWPFSAIGRFGSSVTNPSINRQISQNWTLDPIMVPEKLEAIRAACQWVIKGPLALDYDSMSLLVRPQDTPRGRQRHFGVVEKLAMLPQGWLCVGTERQVPRKGVCYKACCRGTWTWVTQEGMEGLTAFTVIVQNIARVQINSPTLFNPLPYFTPITFVAAEGDPSPPGFKVTAQVVVDQSGHLQTDLPYLPIRLETTGVDSGIRSAISAAGISSVPH